MSRCCEPQLRSAAPAPLHALSLAVHIPPCSVESPGTVPRVACCLRARVCDVKNLWTLNPNPGTLN